MEHIRSDRRAREAALLEPELGQVLRTGQEGRRTRSDDLPDNAWLTRPRRAEELPTVLAGSDRGVQEEPVERYPHSLR